MASRIYEKLNVKKGKVMDLEISIDFTSFLLNVHITLVAETDSYINFHRSLSLRSAHHEYRAPQWFRYS